MTRRTSKTIFPRQIKEVSHDSDEDTPDTGELIESTGCSDCSFSKDKDDSLSDVLNIHDDDDDDDDMLF